MEPPQNRTTLRYEPQGDSDAFEGKENVTCIISMFKKKWPVEDWKRYGFFRESYLRKINIYWLQFPPPSVHSYHILGGLYFFIMTIGIIGNLLFMVMFIRRKTLRTPSNIFVMNLAVSDFLLSSKMPVFIYNSFLLGPALGELGCAIYGFFGGLTGIVSIMSLAAIAFDRYQVIVYPLFRKTKQRIYIQIGLIWLYSAFFSIIPLLDIGFNRYVPEGYLTSCSFDYLSEDYGSRITIIVFFLAAWVVPVSVITTSYAAIYRVIIKTQRTHRQTKMRHCRELEEKKTEVKAALTIIIIIGAWVLAWTPYAVITLLGVTGNKEYITPMSSMIPALFCKTASCIDPYLYSVLNNRFRNELKLMLWNRKGSQRSTRIEQNEIC